MGNNKVSLIPRSSKSAQRRDKMDRVDAIKEIGEFALKFNKFMHYISEREKGDFMKKECDDCHQKLDWTTVLTWCEGRVYCEKCWKHYVHINENTKKAAKWLHSYLSERP